MYGAYTLVGSEAQVVSEDIRAQATRVNHDAAHVLAAGGAARVQLGRAAVGGGRAARAARAASAGRPYCRQVRRVEDEDLEGLGLG